MPQEPETARHSVLEKGNLRQNPSAVSGALRAAASASEAMPVLILKGSKRAFCFGSSSEVEALAVIKATSVMVGVD